MKRRPSKLPGDLPGQFGPLYPDLGATVAKLRRGEDRRAHGAAVLAAILRLQRSSLARETPSHKPSCTSGTAHSDGGDILRAVAASQRASLANAPSAIRKAREPDEWQRLYDLAMADKRQRANLKLAA